MSTFKHAKPRQPFTVTPDAVNADQIQLSLYGRRGSLVAIVTFTRAEARELRDRLGEVLDPAERSGKIDKPAELAAHYGLPWPADACPCCGARVIDGTCLSYESEAADASRPANCTCPHAEAGA